MQKSNTIELLALLEQVNRTNVDKDINQRRIAQIVGDNYKRYPPQPTKKVWTINYTELLELSVIGRDRLKDYK